MATYHLSFAHRDVSPVSYQAQKATLLKYRYDELDDALGMALRMLNADVVPWEITGDDGLVLGRAEIEETVRRRSPELKDRPKPL